MWSESLASFLSSLTTFPRLWSTSYSGTKVLRSTPMPLGGRSRTWPMEAFTTKPSPRYLLIVLALAGDSTMTRSLPFFFGDAAAAFGVLVLVVGVLVLAIPLPLPWNESGNPVRRRLVLGLADRPLRPVRAYLKRAPPSRRIDRLPRGLDHPHHYPSSG